MSVLLNTISSGTSPAPISRAQLDRFCLGVRIVLGRVDHVQQQVGVLDLLERGPERLDQLMGKPPHKAHCV